MASDPVRVLALDPGEKVGWARADVYAPAPDLPLESAVEPSWSNLEHGITSLREMALAIWRKLEHAGTPGEYKPYDLIVVESFRLSATKASSQYGSDLPTVQFIGMVRLLGWIYGVDVVFQGPSIKRTADKTAPTWLQEIIANEPKNHDDAHNVDALRHLWFWTWNTYVAKPVNEVAA